MVWWGTVLWHTALSWCNLFVSWSGARGRWPGWIIAGGAHFTDELWQWRWRRNCPQGPHLWRHNHVEDPEYNLVRAETLYVLVVFHLEKEKTKWGVLCGNGVTGEKGGAGEKKQRSTRWKENFSGFCLQSPFPLLQIFLFSTDPEKAILFVKVLIRPTVS